MYGLFSHIYPDIFNVFKWKGSTTQTSTSIDCQQDPEKEATNTMWITVSIILLAILLAMTVVALGAMVWIARKCVKSTAASKLTTCQGECN